MTSCRRLMHCALGLCFVWLLASCRAPVEFEAHGALNYRLDVTAIEVGVERSHFEFWQTLPSVEWSVTRQVEDERTWQGPVVQVGGLEFQAEIGPPTGYSVAGNGTRTAVGAPEEANQQFRVRVSHPDSPEALPGFISGAQVDVGYNGQGHRADLIHGGSLRYALNLRVDCQSPLTIQATPPALGVDEAHAEAMAWLEGTPPTVVQTSFLDCAQIPTDRVDATVLFDGIVGSGANAYQLKVLAYRARSYRRYNAEIGGLEDIRVVDENARIDIELRDPNAQFLGKEVVPGLGLSLTVKEVDFEGAVRVERLDARYGRDGHRYVANLRGPLAEVAGSETQ